MGATDLLQSYHTHISALIKQAFVLTLSGCGKGAVMLRRFSVHGNKFSLVKAPWAGGQLGKGTEYFLSNCHFALCSVNKHHCLGRVLEALKRIRVKPFLGILKRMGI